MSSTHRPARPDSQTAPPCGHLGRALGRERNPLSRALDRARSRAVVLTAIGIALAALLGAGAGVIHFTEGRRQAEATAARLHHVDALVQGSARKAESTVVGGKAVYRADAAWTYPGTRSNTGSIDVPRTAGPGTTVGIWVDRNGLPATAPPSTVDVLADSLCLGVLLSGLLGLLASAVLCARLHVLDRRADRVWTAAWARSEPVWSGRAPRGGEHG